MKHKGRWPRRVATGLGVLVLLALLATVFAGAWLRGPVLAAVADRLSRRLCGKVTIEGGSLGVLAVPRLLSSQPVDVHLENVIVRDPKGTVVLQAETIDVQLVYERDPDTLVLRDLQLTRGSWSLVSAGPGQPVGFFHAFRSQNQRPACVAAAPGPVAVAPPTPEKAGLKVRLESARLHALDVVLSFATWGLSLDAADARGTFQVVHDDHNRPRVLFDVKPVIADAGVLRIGGEGKKATPIFNFARIAIDRVAVDPRAPEDIQLVVRSGQSQESARAILTGHATFLAAFAVPSPEKLGRAGMVLDARYKNFGDVLPALVDRLGLQYPPGAEIPTDLAVTLIGPYQWPNGSVRLGGPHVRLMVGLLPEKNISLAALLDGLALSPYLPESLQRPLAGTLDGRIEANLALANPEQLQAALTRLSLDLRRRARDSWPRRLHIRGPDSPSARAGSDDLILRWGRALISEGLLQVGGIGLQGAGFHLRGGQASLLVAKSQADGALQAPVLSVHIRSGTVALGRLFPGAPVAGTVAFSARVDGSPTVGLRSQIDFPTNTRVKVAGTTIGLPNRLQAERGRDGTLSVRRFRIEIVPGGFLSVWGHYLPGGTIDAGLWVKQYPLQQLAQIATAGKPPEGKATTLIRSLRGYLMASVRVRGKPAAPRISGLATLARVRIADVAMGGGGLKFDAVGPGRVRFAGQLVRGLGVSGQARMGDSPALSARLHLKDFSAGAFLPRSPPLRQSLRPLNWSGDVDLAIAPGTQNLDASLRATGDAGGVFVTAHMDDRRVDAFMRGRVIVGSIAAAITDRVQARGQISVDLHAGILRSEIADTLPTLQGEIVTVTPIRLQGPALPIAIALAPGGKLRIDGEDIDVDNLHIRGVGSELTVNGRVHARRGDPDPKNARIDLVVKGRLDPATIAKRIPALESATGRVMVDARVKGSAVKPSIHGALTVEQVSVRAPALEPLGGITVNGIIDAAGDTLSTQDLTIRAGKGGRVIFGGAFPARVVIRQFSPFRTGDVTIPILAERLDIDDPRGRLSAKNLGFDLQLSDLPKDRFLLKGNVRVDRVTLGKGEKAEGVGGKATKRKTRQGEKGGGLGERLVFDVVVMTEEDAVRVRLPAVPDVQVGLRCRLRGTLDDLAATGQIRGDGPYSKALVFAYDVLSKQAVRRCGVLIPPRAQ